MEQGQATLDWFFTLQSLQHNAHPSKCGFVNFLQTSRANLDPGSDGQSHVDFFHFALDLKRKMLKTSHCWGMFSGCTLIELPRFYGSILNLYMQTTHLYTQTWLSWIPGCPGNNHMNPPPQTSQKWRNLKQLSISSTDLDPGCTIQVTI